MQQILGKKENHLWWSFFLLFYSILSVEGPDCLQHHQSWAKYGSWESLKAKSRNEENATEKDENGRWNQWWGIHHASLKMRSHFVRIARMHGIVSKKNLKYTQCLKITEKSLIRHCELRSYVYILSGQKFIKNAKNWLILANFRKH